MVKDWVRGVALGVDSERGVQRSETGIQKVCVLAKGVTEEEDEKAESGAEDKGWGV